LENPQNLTYTIETEFDASFINFSTTNRTFHINEASGTEKASSIEIEVRLVASGIPE
jgi:hypothetical protein